MLRSELNEILDFLKEKSLPAELIKKNKDVPVDRIVVKLGRDEKKRGQELELFRFEKELSLKGEDKDANAKKAVFLRITQMLPFTFQDKTVADVARYALLVNKGLEYVGFGVSEVDRAIYFRYDLHCSLNTVSEEVLMGILGYASLIVDSFSPKFESLSTGEKDFLQVVAEDQG